MWRYLGPPRPWRPAGRAGCRRRPPCPRRRAARAAGPVVPGRGRHDPGAARGPDWPTPRRWPSPASGWPGASTWAGPSRPSASSSTRSDATSAGWPSWRTPPSGSPRRTTTSRPGSWPRPTSTCSSVDPTAPPPSSVRSWRRSRTSARTSRGSPPWCWPPTWPPTSATRRRPRPSTRSCSRAPVAWWSSGPGIACFGSAARPLGALAPLLGEHDAAEGHLEAALAANEALGATPWVARTHLARALARTRRGEVASATTSLTAARRLATALASPALLGACAQAEA